MPSTPSPSAAARLTGRIVISTMAGALVLLVALLAWVGVRGMLAYGELRAVQSQLSGSSAEELLAAADTLPAIADRTATARALTSDPIWKIAEGLPWAGPQLAAVATVAAAIDETAGSAFAPLIDVARVLRTEGVVTGGRVDVSRLDAVESAVALSAARIARASASVDAIDPVPLVAPLRTGVADVGALLDQATTVTGSLSRAATLLPAMLGADGPRNILLLFQNNAEWRSLGGIPGALALVRAENGALTMIDQSAASGFPRYDESVLPLGTAAEAIFTQSPGRWMQNVTEITDFQVAASLAREMWMRERGGTVDAVVAVDPVVLSYLLAVTGPVQLPSGQTLTAENAVPLLLNGVYLATEDPRAQDAFFAEAAAAVFTSLSAGTAEPTALLSALSRAGDERRLLLWSAYAEEQALLAQTTLAGGLPVTDATTARFGVYVNDGTGSKMDYYASLASTVSWGSCTVDASGAAQGTATLTTTIANNAPADAATSLPAYVTGGGGFGIPPGIARTIGYVYLPQGFELLDAQLPGSAGFGGGYHDGRRVLRFAIDLAPGTSATLTVTARAAAPAAPRLEVVSTPTLGATAVTPAVCGGGR